jgi:hypothetical protein
MILEHISLERLEEIEQERATTQSDPEFQSWMIQLNISRMYIDRDINRDGIVRANQMMEEWKMNSLDKTH